MVSQMSQASAFHNQLRCRILAACIERENSLSELAAKLAAPLPKLHYHVKRLIRAGLLSISRSVPRPGRPVRYYRAVAERFLVPQAMLPQLPADDWAAELRQALRDENSRAGDLSVLYTADECGRMKVRLVRPDSSYRPRSLEIWRRLRLDPQQRAEFGRELAELMERYARAEPGAAAEPYLTHVAFAPRK